MGNCLLDLLADLRGEQEEKLDENADQIGRLIEVERDQRIYGEARNNQWNGPKWWSLGMREDAFPGTRW